MIRCKIRYSGRGGLTGGTAAHGLWQKIHTGNFLPVIKLLTQAQAASLKGVTPRRLRQLDTEDNPPPKTETGQYAPEEFGKWLIISAVNSDYNYQEERARLTHHQANKTELEHRVLKGDLIPSNEVSRVWGDMVTKFRSKMLALPGRLSTTAMAASPVTNNGSFWGMIECR